MPTNKFNQGDEFIYSEDNMDYTVVGITTIRFVNKTYYLCHACDYTNPVQSLKLEITNEDKMTLTNCMDVLTKVWANITRDQPPSKFRDFVRNRLIGPICDYHAGTTHAVEFDTDDIKDTFKMTFDGVEFIK